MKIHRDRRVTPLGTKRRPAASQSAQEAGWLRQATCPDYLSGLRSLPCQPAS